MIHSTEPETTSGSRGESHAAHSRHGAHEVRVTGNHRGISSGGWPVLGFGHEPEINSLWDTTLLDRLSEPLTRFHE